MKAYLETVLVFGLLSPLAAQELRVALDEAPLVLVGRHRGVRPHGEDFLLHKVAVARTLLGEAEGDVGVVEWKKVSFHNRPAIGATRLYCLHPVAETERLGLPAGRWFRLDAHPGSHPAVDEAALAAGTDPVVRLADLLAAARSDGIAAKKDALLELALEAPSHVRLEAARLLAERPALLDALNPFDLAVLLGKASAETADVDYKLALATACAERRVPDLIEALCITWPKVDDETWSQAMGRFAKHLHGEGATEQLLPYLQRTRDHKLRRHVLLALGATSTESALAALLRIRALEKDTAMVDAALRLHGAPRAIEAVEHKR